MEDDDEAIRKVTTIRVWGSPGALSRDLAARFAKVNNRGPHQKYLGNKLLPVYAIRVDRDRWAGEMTSKEASRALISGADEAFTRRALSMYERIDADSLLTVGPNLWEAAPVGPLPLVPAAISGVPLAMLDRTGHNAALNNPVKIVVNRMTSASVTPDTVEKIGAACIALAMTLARVRPVQLMCGFMCGVSAAPKNAYGYFVDLGTAPWDLPQMSFVVSHPAALRGALFGIHGMTEFAHDNIPWPWDRYSEASKMEQRTRIVLDMGPDDILVGGARLSDQHEIVKDPRGWIAKQLERFLTSRQ